MMMEYKIANKVKSFTHFQEERMNNNLIYSDNDHILHVIKEINFSKGWHKRTVTIAVSEKDNPQTSMRATFETKEKIRMLISLLESHMEEME